MSKLSLGYVPRKQFIPFHLREQRWACLVCHRRAGKTYAIISDLIDHCLSSTLVRPRYAYIAPLLKQAKGVAWDHARAIAAPLIIRNLATVNEAELRIDFAHNGARLQLHGADNPDALRGRYFDGVCFDEYADMEPRLWPEIIRPALNDRQGWAVFIGTPRGHNIFWDIRKEAEDNPDDWFYMMLKASESGIVPQRELDDTRSKMTEDQYKQEYECDFEASVHGAYFAKLMGEARAAGRICSVPYDPSVPVWTSWDLGSTATAIWFAQLAGKEVHLIDYYEASGEGLGHYVRALRERPYVYARHIFPHDVEAQELGPGKSRLETLQALGIFDVIVLPNASHTAGLEEEVNAARLLIPKCWFDARNCERGIEALTLYRAEQDPRHIDPITKQPLLKGKPVHDWTSHAADSFRYMAMGLDHKGFYSNFYRPIDYPKGPKT